MAYIELMIKIPKELYESYKGRPPMLGDVGIDMIAQSIANGTPLPKGHGDLIDRDWCLKMKCTDLVDADGVTMYAVPTGNILKMIPVIPAEKGEA